MLYIDAANKSRSDGMSVLGEAPVITTGGVFFVDSGSALAVDDPAHGRTPNRPFATFDYAVGRTTANNGDIIYLMPGHAENLDAATDAVVDVAGLRIIGVGVRDNRPTFTYTGTSGTFEVDSANTYIENVRFLASVSAVVVGVNVDAANVTFNNCEWDFDATGDDFLIFVDTTGVAGTEFHNCRFLAEEGTAGAATGIRARNADDLKVIGCFAKGDFSVAVIADDTANDTGGGTSLSTGIEIRGNTFYNDDTTVGTCIDLNLLHTGVIAYNNLGTTGLTGIAALLDPGGCVCIENYGSSQSNDTGSGDRSAALTPATTDTVA